MAMGRQMRWREMAQILLILSVVVEVCAQEPAEQDPEWWTAQRDVVAMLSEQKTDITELVAKVTTSPPETGIDAMRKLNVLMRAGMNAEATEAVKELKSLCPDLDNHQVGQIYYDACDDYQAWELARRIVEVFADSISEMALDNRLLKYFLESGRTVDEIDRWLAGMPAGRDGFWIKQRLRFNNIHGRAERLIQELTERIKQDPQDIERAITFLDSLIFARHTGQENWDLSWMPETIHPQLATQTEKIASHLKTLASWETAAVFYRHAVDTPLTDKEANDLASTYQAFMAPERLRAAFAARIREGLAKCLLEMGRNDEAQKWMVEAADIRAEHGFGLNALFAGQVQGASGQRVIESRIEEEEDQREDDPRYWRQRAQYYRGRNEPDQEEKALRTGLALTKPLPRPERVSKGYADMRRWLLRDYAHFLKRMDRVPEAVALLYKEIEQAPADAMSAEGAAYMLAFDFPKHIDPNDAVLWYWLADRPKWEHTESRLLWRILERVSQSDLDAYFIHAEELAKQTDPTRASVVGWIMNRMQHPKRSIPLLEYAIQNAQDDELKQRATFALFESYLDTGDWKQAEQIFTEACKRLSPTEVPDWYCRIAVAAAQAGAKSDAMRIWKAAANINPSDLAPLPSLVAVGLRDELAAFYRDMAARLPTSETPARALKMLGER